MRALVLPLPQPRLPPVIAALGERASYRFFEFFTAQIRNPNTRRAHARAAMEFFDWLAVRGVTRLAAIESVHVAAYIEQLHALLHPPDILLPPLTRSVVFAGQGRHARFMRLRTSGGPLGPSLRSKLIHALMPPCRL